jgi:DNA polymerase II large subunit
MDAPLVLTTRLNPSEIDKEALNVDCSWNYTRAFYEATLSQPHSRDVRNLVDLVEDRLGTIGDLRGYGWTHDSGPLDAGPQNSAYKTLVTMKDKLTSQLELGRVLRPVNVAGVAKRVIESHFLPDMRGNMMAFTRQKVRCVKCGKSYRRMPLAGKCIKESSQGSGGFSGVGDGESSMCGGNVVLTVSEGSVRKYIEVTQSIIEEYGIDDYTKHRVDWMESSVDSLFTNDRVTVMTLEDFI